MNDAYAKEKHGDAHHSCYSAQTEIYIVSFTCTVF